MVGYQDQEDDVDRAKAMSKELMKEPGICIAKSKLVLLLTIRDFRQSHCANLEYAIILSLEKGTQWARGGLQGLTKSTAKRVIPIITRPTTPHAS